MMSPVGSDVIVTERVSLCTSPPRDRERIADGWRTRHRAVTHVKVRVVVGHLVPQRCRRSRTWYFEDMSDMSDDAQAVGSSRSDRDEELVVEPDDSGDAAVRGEVELGISDAELALREAGGDADRAEEILEIQRQPHDERHSLPTDERPA